MLLCVLVFTVLVTLSSTLGSAHDFYSLSAVNMQGEHVPLEQYRGKVILVVNLASECGYTDHNYKQLTSMQDLYGRRGFTVLAFPCNQFGQQEPGTDSEILFFATKKYDANFPIFSKVDVKGENMCDVYRYLTESTGSFPNWNFNKYLIDRHGEVVQFFTATDTFTDIKQSISYLLSKQK